MTPCFTAREPLSVMCFEERHQLQTVFLFSLQINTTGLLLINTRSLQ